MNLDLYAIGAATGSWILTYLLHLTVLLSGAALAAFALRARPELEEAIWKLALVGGLLTASLPPAVAVWRATQIGEQGSVSHQVAPVAAIPLVWASAPETKPMLEATTVAPTVVWRTRLIVGWAAVTLLLLARLLTAAVGLRRRLAGRRSIATGPLARLVDRLLAAAGRRRTVRLTRTDGIPVPIALGGEICLPERALRELPRHEQETVVAHEMAHVLRRDPAWLLAGRVLGALFFFHPLVLLAGRRLRRVAELRCDDWAAAATGRPLALARCLTRVAGWGGEVMPAAAMAGDRRRLAGRVTRLLRRDRDRLPTSAPGWLRPASAAALLAVALWIPGISLAGDTPPEAPQAPEAPEAPDPAAAPSPPVAVPVPVVEPVPAPTPVPAPVVAPPPVVAPLPPVRPAFAIPAPGPLPAAQREELRRLAGEIAAQRVRMAAEMAQQRQHIARELAGQHQAIAEEARRIVEQARRSAVESETQRERLREMAREMAEQAEQMRAQARQEAEGIAPELEKLRQELRLRTEEREALRRELETLRRELEILRQQDG